MKRANQFPPVQGSSCTGQKHNKRPVNGATISEEKERPVIAPEKRAILGPTFGSLRSRPSIELPRANFGIPVSTQPTKFSFPRISIKTSVVLPSRIHEVKRARSQCYTTIKYSRYNQSNGHIGPWPNREISEPSCE